MEFKVGEKVRIKEEAYSYGSNLERLNGLIGKVIAANTDLGPPLSQIVSCEHTINFYIVDIHDDNYKDFKVTVEECNLETLEPLKNELVKKVFEEIKRCRENEEHYAGHYALTVMPGKPLPEYHQGKKDGAIEAYDNLIKFINNINNF